MKKSKRIAIGGWLSRTLSIMTRGWFGGVEEIAEVVCIKISDTALHTVAVAGAPAYVLDLSDMSVQSVTMSELLPYSVSLDDIGVSTVTLTDEACND